MKDNNSNSSNVKRASYVGLLIGVGLFLAFPLSKTGIVSDIVATVGGAIIIVYVVSSIRKRNKLKISKDIDGAM